MTKTELIQAVSQESNIRVADVTDVMKALEKVILDASKTEEKIALSWCTIKFVNAPARDRRNPKTGVTFPVAAHTEIKIKPVVGFRKQISG